MVECPPLSEAENIPQYKHDDQFYFDFIVFLVEDRLFKVPRNRFMAESPVFRTMTEFPPGPNLQVDGMSDEQPLRLDLVGREEFISLLRFFFPSDVKIILNAREWCHILRLANMWDMQAVRSHAMTRLAGTLTTSSKLAVAIDHNIEEWILPTLETLVFSSEAIMPGDLSNMGAQCASKIFAARKAVRSCTPHLVYRNTNIIRDIFGELLDIASLKADKDATASGSGELFIRYERRRGLSTME
ncbi:hypothetical protein ONZ45_g11454 [Pleurotus djamor]|nr:hypothetical protein ONZ45_g11454 [Pleurotus djamor]